MLSSPLWFFRLFRLMITSALCSVPIYLGYFISISDRGMLALSFLAFVAVIGIDAYYFSFTFWTKQNYYFGQLLPFVIYIVMGFLTCVLCPPVVFNRFFLPLRFAGVFGIRTIVSIGIVSIVVIAIVTALSFFGARSGHLFEEEIKREQEEMQKFAAKLAESMHDDNVKA